MIAGIDSMVLIYAGIVPSASKPTPTNIADLTLRAKLLLHTLANEKATVILPTVAIAELLVPVPSADKGSLMAALTKRFVCPPLDLHAAAIASDLWSQHRKLPQNLQYTNRHVLKSDAMIVGSAKAAGATVFYSHDTNCRAMAKLVMEASDLPRRPKDGDMFLMDDIKRGEV